MWSAVNFGKWSGKGLTLPQIILRDPDWFFWALKNNAFKGGLRAEAEDLGRKATHIKLPEPNPSGWRVEYAIGHDDGKFADFEIVPMDRPQHEGSTLNRRVQHLDLSFPSRLHSYDKLGCRLMLRNFKFYWFGSTGARLTKDRCEAFFDDPSNFA
jgi:hypothetical protein